MRALPLVRGWDAALTYGSIHTAAKEREGPFFVGRETLLGSLVQAISQPELRGTYLISGYRGAGKTSLVIEAARRAKPELGSRKLLTLVLNVSEVSASLEAADTAETPELRIDARRVITALLRSLHNEVDEPELSTRIADVYAKATATQFTQTLQRRSELSATQLEQHSRTFAVANVLNGIGALSTAGAAVLGATWLGAGAAFPVAIAALAAVAVASFTWARSSERKTVDTDSADRQLTTDNSLHQIETDLREILARLAACGYRTMFVLEELDKLTEGGGEQLRNVIRYFKNLFTQAPALFFFLTDKEYFDSVDQKIAAERLKGSYAIEHTFFTQRIFVTRPSLEECLDYFDRVLVDARAPVEAIRSTQRHRVRRVADMSPEEVFLRGLLFNAQNHLFDLKAEMRGYVQVDGIASRLEFDETALTAEEEGIAAFQFLLEQKARVYRFDGGRDYANETLRNCLSRVFADIGGELPHPIDSLYPEASGPGAQISRTERRRVVAAVGSLLAELERGGAIDRQTGSGDATFRWRDNPAANFSPMPELEPAERKLEATLRRAIRVAEAFDAQALAADLARAIDDMSGRDQPMVAEETDRHAADVNKALADVMLRPREEHLAAMSRQSTPEPIGRTVYLFPGRTLLVYGVEEEHQRLVASYLETANPERAPVAVVLVDDDPGPDTGVRAAWRAALAPVTDPTALLVTRVPLVEGAQAAQEELWFANAWSLARASEPATDAPVRFWLPGGVELSHTLSTAVRAWLESDSAQLAIVAPLPAGLRHAFAVASAQVDVPRLLAAADELGTGGGRLVPVDVPDAPRSIVTRPQPGLHGVTTLRLGDDVGELTALADLLGPEDERAWSLYASAADRGDVEAMIQLMVRTPNAEQAQYWEERVIASGDVDAMRRAAEASGNLDRRERLSLAARQKIS